MKTYPNRGSLYNTHKAIFVTLSCVLFLTACKKFIVIPPPETTLVTTNVFSSDATAHSAQIAIYTQMYNESYFMAQNMGIYSDELKNYSNTFVYQQLYVNSLVSTGSYGPWSSGYNYIFEENSIIENLQKSSGVSAGVKQQLLGEAKFIRAFWLLYLTNIYGDIPLTIASDYSSNKNFSRTSRIKILQQVILDLQDAQKILNTNYVDVTDTVKSTERIRPNQSSAASLLARSYLYLADYSKDNSLYKSAEDQATSVINNSLYGLTSLNSTFLKNSSETIWQLATPVPSPADVTDGSQFNLVAAPTSTALSQQLFNSFEANDQRKVNWIGSYVTPTTPNITYYFPNKYKSTAANYVASNIKEYTMVLRLAEQYLIRAEARAQQGNIGGAIIDLNVIRKRAGLADYAGLQDKSSLLAAILHERQVELFTEWGHRWFDLCRTGNAPTVMSTITSFKGGKWNADNYQLLFPIPQADINADPNLTQNPGY